MNRTKQYNTIKLLNIPGIREVGNGKFECKCIDDKCPNNSNSDKRKKAGFFWSVEKNQYIYHCFRCGVALSFSRFLKKYFYDEYMNLFLSKYNGDNISNNDGQKLSFIKIPDDEIKGLIDHLFKNGELIPFNKCKDMDIVSYVVDRKIPESKHHNFFVASNFYNINQQIKQLMNPDREFTCSQREDKRLVWMFRDRTNNVIAMQGRRIDKAEPRYMISRFNNEDTGNRLIGGLENLDINETVYVVEGYIDSLFLPNSVSLNGLHLPTIQYLIDEIKVKDVVVVFDNEPSNDQIKRNIAELADMSINYPFLRVCLLPADMRKQGKDINDYIKCGYSPDQLLKIINSNSYNQSTLKVRSVFW